ncbi:hypothetical protein Tco_1368089 [Tanacetum coccineum]|uniref:Uncharacterized protein n=1 Tax=Tanacetum coccineum TaxID=301880 RepID=A0ABQ4XNY6_9ASTR
MQDQKPRFHVGDLSSSSILDIRFLVEIVNPVGSGPFTVVQLFLMHRRANSKLRPNFKLNGHRIKHYFGGDIPTEVVPDLQTFPHGPINSGNGSSVGTPNKALRGRHPMLIPNLVFRINEGSDSHFTSASTSQLRFRNSLSKS